ncbi:MAG TPA: cytochrome P450 [Streptosporangiaceae bacterium]|nr:cytochrome P450 [Streptosporangiaceae bacterium]
MTQDGLPDPLLLELAADNPVLPVAGPGGKAWLITGHEAVREALSEPSRFTSVIDPAVTDARARAGVSMVGLDPPDHTRVRKLAAKAFTARRIQGLVPSVERVVTTLLDAMAEAGPPADLVTSLAVPLPLHMMCQMLDLPAEDQPGFLRWSDVFTGMNTGYTMEEVADANDKLHAYMLDLAARRRKHLGEDLLSDLIRARDGEDALTEQELLNTMVLLLVAGHQTTVRAIARSVLVLLHSGQWKRFAAAEVTAEQVVEEALRHQTPIDTGLFRRAAVDTEIAGVQIKAGEQVFLSVHLANFDRNAWHEPHVFDPGRGDQRHLAFGHGVHFCLGAPLARLELSTALSLLAARFPGLRMDVPLDELTWTVGSWLNSLVALPVTW